MAIDVHRVSLFPSKSSPSLRWLGTPKFQIKAPCFEGHTGSQLREVALPAKKVQDCPIPDILQLDTRQPRAHEDDKDKVLGCMVVCLKYIKNFTFNILVEVRLGHS